MGHPTGASVKLYGVAEIARALGTRRQTVAMWRSRGRLPPPDAVLASGPVWLASTIEPWIAQQRGHAG
jgi:predicted DNA-binding transcriptional regulator AlpA